MTTLTSAPRRARRTRRGHRRVIVVAGTVTLVLLAALITQQVWQGNTTLSHVTNRPVATSQTAAQQSLTSKPSTVRLFALPTFSTPEWAAYAETRNTTTNTRTAALVSYGDSELDKVVWLPGLSQYFKGQMETALRSTDTVMTEAKMDALAVFYQSCSQQSAGASRDEIVGGATTGRPNLPGLAAIVDYALANCPPAVTK